MTADRAEPAAAADMSADPTGSEWTGTDQAHRDFAASIFALVTMLVHHFMMRDIIKAEDVRDLLEAYLAKPGSAAGSVAPRQLLDQVKTFIKTRDAACFSRTIEIARGHGRLPAEGHGSA
jgi:hypothetical protein